MGKASGSNQSQMDADFGSIYSDPAKIDPRHVKVALENDRVRAIRVTLGPRETVPLHSHPSAVGVFLTEASLRNDLSEKSPENVRARPGDVVWFEPTTHATTNTGRLGVELVIIELKQPPLP
jgi:quercetin dioxygenase-like cupin family protein